MLGLENHVRRDEFCERQQGYAGEHGFGEHGASGLVFAPDDIEIVDHDLRPSLFGPRDQSRHAVRTERVVGIKHSHPAAARCVQPGIARRTWASIMGHGDQAHARIGVIADDVPSAVAGAIVDDDHLHADSALRKRAVDGALQRLLGIVGCDDETDIRDEIRHCGAFSRFPYCSISRTPNRPLTTPACMMPRRP